MRIRPAAAGDAEAVLEIMRETPTLPQWSLEALALPGTREEGVGLHRALLVADLDGVVAGFAQCSVLLEEAELESMAVRTALRRHGIGRSLLLGVVTEVRRRGAACLRLEVRRGNAAATELYRSVGMHVVGERRAYYRDPVEDALVMQHRWERDGLQAFALRYDWV